MTGGFALYSSDVFSIKVKMGADLQVKSLKVYGEKFVPKGCIRTAMVEYKKQEWLVNLPLWAVETYSEHLNKYNI